MLPKFYLLTIKKALKKNITIANTALISQTIQTLQKGYKFKLPNNLTT